jgi:MscS family membrane protein
MAQAPLPVAVPKPDAPKPDAPKTDAAPATDPLSRDSPESAVSAFLEACHRGDYARAQRYLNLRGLRQQQRFGEGPHLAQQLGEILNRDANFDLASLSRQPEGSHEAGLSPDQERLESLKLGDQIVAILLERVTLRSGVKVWEFSRDTVAWIPKLVQGTSSHAIEKDLPAPLVSVTLVDTPLWRWIAFVLLAAALSALSKLSARIAVGPATWLAKRTHSGATESMIESLWAPVRWLLCLGIFGAGMEWIGPSPLLRVYLERGVAALFFLGLAWLGARIIDVGMGHLRSLLVAKHQNLSHSVLPMASRLLKIAVLMLTIAAILGDWGYNATAILAGLGVGSIAIALAAQKTIENFFGSVSVISDRPVSVGDFCRFGDRLGTVEDIGLRSTRLRTIDRTVVSVPNAQFSSMTLENFNRRDKMLFHLTLNLRRDTTPEQVRTLLELITRIVTEHANVEAGSLPARFIGVGTYSLDLEIFVYVQTRDGDEFLSIQQDLLLRILEAVQTAGTALALPTQASVSYAANEPSEPQGPSRNHPLNQEALRRVSQ